MSVVAVRRYEDKIVVSADEQVSTSRNKFKIGSDEKLVKNVSKLFKVNKMIIGGVGSLEQLVLFRTYCKTHKPSNFTEEGLMDFMVEFEDWARKRDQQFKLMNDYIIVADEEAFLCEGIYVAEIGEYNAIGSGGFLALGALYMGANTEKAVEVAKEFDMYCSGETITFKHKVSKK